MSRPDQKWILGHSTKRKLTDEQAQEIMRRRAEGESSYSLARRFGLSQPGVLKLLGAGGYRPREYHIQRRIIRKEEQELRHVLMEARKARLDLLESVGTKVYSREKKRRREEWREKQNSRFT